MEVKGLQNVWITRQKGYLALLSVITLANSLSLTSTTPPVSPFTPLRCRQCNRASSLDDCNQSIQCNAGEKCYIDELITSTTKVVYNAGCRAATRCSGTGVIGKKSDLTSCSRCCDSATLPECNTKLCGIKPANSALGNLTECFVCDRQVYNTSDCTHIARCQSDETCMTRTFRAGTSASFEFNCLNVRICSLLMGEALKRLHECRTGQYCPDVTKRQASLVCSACCGDSLCNGIECRDVMDNLYNLWINNRLDMTTMKEKPSSG